MHTYQY